MSTRATALIFVVLTVIATQAVASTVYISDELRVPLRSSPCSRCAIIHYGLVAGTEMTLVEANEDGWSHVTTSGGLDGWLESQYLVEQPIARDRLTAVQARLARLEEENSALKTSLAELRSTREKLASRLDTTQEQKSSIDDELKKIKKISSNALNLHEQNQELLKRNRMLQSEIDVLTAVREQLESDDTQKWFLYGAVAVFLGALLTLLIPRFKPRKRFSEWA